jgi:hypothetical protein
MRSAARRALPVEFLLFAAGLATVLLVLPAVAAGEVCPNAVLRTGLSARLPDCRAYEMVTPPYKEGYKVEKPESSEDGSALLGESLGTFAGSENTGQGVGNRVGLERPLGAYGFVRSGSGWVTAALDPPSSLFPTSFIAGWDPGDGSSLWYSETSSEQQASPKESGLGQFVLRSADGSLAEVGPAFPPSTSPLSIEKSDFGQVAYEGATSDLSRVFFTQTAFHWPYDPSPDGVSSLYEYVGTNNAAPLLVGVSGGAGSTSVISKCGTTLAGGESRGDALGSLGVNGARVLFGAQACGSSPPVNELFAREDNELPDAHTVAISEPSRADCAECDTEEGVLTSAGFLGASPGAAEVFFSTSQPLLGDDVTPNIYEYDFDAPAGQRVVRVSGGDATVSNPVANVQSVAGISHDGSHVYFVATGVLTTTPNSEGQTASEGVDNLYVFERDAQYPGGRTAFIASVSPGAPSVSADGRFLAFTSTAHLTPGDTSSGSQLFEYDAQTGSLVRASIGEDGYDDNGNDAAPEGIFQAADDGAVLFGSRSPLIPEAVSGAISVYEYREGSVYLISSGLDAGGSYLVGVDASGEDVFFETQEELLPQDGDTEWDVYDARVDGGFPPPLAPSPCAGDACQGPLSGAPVLLSPGSEFQAGSNPVVEASKPAAKAKVKAKAKAKKKKRRGKRDKKKGGKASRARHAIARNGGRS